MVSREPDAGPSSSLSSLRIRRTPGREWDRTFVEQLRDAMLTLRNPDAGVPHGRFRAWAFGRGWRSALAIVAVAAVVAVNAGCGGGDESLSVVAPAEGLHQSTVDLGPEGKSGGDIYVFDGPLLDSDEEETIGSVYGTQTSIAQDKDSETVQAMITYDFGEGDRITIGGIGEYPRGDLGLVENQRFERPILGGTGRYAGADGTITSVRRPDGGYEHTFELED